MNWDLVVLQGSGKENVPYSGLKVRAPNDAMEAEDLDLQSVGSDISKFVHTYPVLPPIHALKVLPGNSLWESITITIRRGRW